VYILNPLILCALLALHIFDVAYLIPSMAIVLASSLTIEVLFMYCCVKLLKYWNSFELPENKCVNNVSTFIRSFAVGYM
jgi:hypothetical protein